MTQVAPSFSLERAAWVPCVVVWDERTDELHRVEGGTATAESATRIIP
jgi:hypothetical protein